MYESWSIIFQAHLRGVTSSSQKIDLHATQNQTVSCNLSTVFNNKF